MNKVYVVLMCAGLFIAAFYGYEWWQSTQAVEQVDAEETERWNTEEASEVQEIETASSHSKEQAVVMSNEINAYEKGEEVGRLIIPAIEKGFTTYWGTDEETLSQGVGMYVSQYTTTPDQGRHTVLSGHRDTVFTGLNNVQKDDPIFFEFDGKRYEYIVVGIKVVDEDDRTVIVDKEEATLTLTTCYPFEFIGHAPERYVIQSELVNVMDM
ncbi:MULTISPECIES: class D sortase [Bacillales]|uniref:class D sortase n=1 Tax=Bacillales TaxID=1385 RepID=UPI00188326EB|nr:class D sortase [Pseudalkalibacillus hwajinpoensis]MBF0705080.1 class D sortase [Pseudalkalibacillus hwajinpoensis]